MLLSVNIISQNEQHAINALSYVSLPLKNVRYYIPMSVKPTGITQSYARHSHQCGSKQPLFDRHG